MTRAADFPDLNYKCLIHSRSEGSIMVIPRENSLVRFYVQLQSHDASGKAIAIERSKATQDICIERAKAILSPFKLEFGYVDWFSVYQIGQRIASNYTLDHKIFLGGDATHTHSPKAGQGCVSRDAERTDVHSMNISMLDMYSLAWKLNLVEKGVGKADVLLPTYESERRSVAQELLKFDSAYSRLFSGRAPPGQSEVEAHDADKAAMTVRLPSLSPLTLQGGKSTKTAAVDAQKFIEAFKANVRRSPADSLTVQARFTSGCGAVYFANVLNALPDADIVKGPHGHAFNPSGLKLVCGERLLPGMVIRAFDANQVKIHQEIPMNGAFRSHVLAGDLKSTSSQLAAFSKHLERSNSFLNAHRPAEGVRASMLDGVRDGVVSIRQKAAASSSHKPNPCVTASESPLTLQLLHLPDDHCVEPGRVGDPRPADRPLLLRRASLQRRAFRPPRGRGRHQRAAARQVRHRHGQGRDRRGPARRLRRCRRHPRRRGLPGARRLLCRVPAVGRGEDWPGQALSSRRFV